MKLSWFAKDSHCSLCGYPVVVTQGKVRDYMFYCSNPNCAHHAPVDLFDTEKWPNWISKEEK